MVLLLNVLLDDFVGDVATADAEVSARPHVTTPELLSQVRKLMHHFIRTLPFQHLEQPADGHLRWNAHKQMDMIFRDMPLDDGDLLIAADLSNQLSETGADFTCHDRLTILRDPDQMQMNLEGSVRAAPVIFHRDESYRIGAALHTY